jgi:peroxiredoxin Q/BCP
MNVDAIAADMPAVGDLAPEFELPDDSGNVRRLSDMRGRWLVLYFYPKDDTPGCTTEACEFRDAIEEIAAQGAEVWGVSVLGSASKSAFKRKLGLPFTLLADEQHEVAERYGTWVEKENYGRRYWGIGRTTFLTDPNGRIARVWSKVRPQGHAADVLAALAEAQTADQPVKK